VVPETASDPADPNRGGYPRDAGLRARALLQDQLRDRPKPGAQIEACAEAAERRFWRGCAKKAEHKSAVAADPAGVTTIAIFSFYINGWRNRGSKDWRDFPPVLFAAFSDRIASIPKLTLFQTLPIPRVRRLINSMAP
jgi:hypothetical protein